MAMVKIRLSEGRTATVTQFWARATYDGFIEGDLEALNAEICSTQRQRAIEMCKIIDPLHVVAPQTPLSKPLPSYFCVAYLEAEGAVRGEPGDVSYLIITWLGDAPNTKLADEIADVLTKVSWDATAKSAAWSDYL